MSFDLDHSDGKATYKSKSGYVEFTLHEFPNKDAPDAIAEMVELSDILKMVAGQMVSDMLTAAGRTLEDFKARFPDLAAHLRPEGDVP